MDKCPFILEVVQFELGVNVNTVNDNHSVKWGIPKRNSSEVVHCRVPETSGSQMDVLLRILANQHLCYEPASFIIELLCPFPDATTQLLCNRATQVNVVFHILQPTVQHIPDNVLHFVGLKRSVVTLHSWFLFHVFTEWTASTCVVQNCAAWLTDSVNCSRIETALPRGMDFVLVWRIHCHAWIVVAWNLSVPWQNGSIRNWLRSHVMQRPA